MGAAGAARSKQRLLRPLARSLGRLTQCSLPLVTHHSLPHRRRRSALASKLAAAKHALLLPAQQQPAQPALAAATATAAQPAAGTTAAAQTGVVVNTSVRQTNVQVAGGAGSRLGLGRRLAG